MIFLLCACSSNDANNENNNEEVIDNANSEFISPINKENIFEYLNDETKDLLYKANGDKDVDTTVLTNLGKELIEGNIVDYNGNTVNLSDYKNKKLVIEVVASWCSHCKDQAKNYSDDLLNVLSDDTVFIQYFVSGNNEEIAEFYNEIDLEVPTNIIIGVNNDELTNTLIEKYDFEFTPSFYFFNNGVLTWQLVGTLDSDDYKLFEDIAFNDGLNLDMLVDNSGNSIFNSIRDEEDIKNDLSQENYAKLESLDNDGNTISYTLKYLGVDVDYYHTYSNESEFESEVSYVDYADSDLIVVFINEYDETIISMLNEFTSTNPNINLVCLNTSDEDNKLIAYKLDAKLSSIMNEIPKIFDEMEFPIFPSALFIKKGIITGAYSNIESSSKLLEAYNLFLTDKSIALIANN